MQAQLGHCLLLYASHWLSLRSCYKRSNCIQVRRISHFHSLQNSIHPCPAQSQLLMFNACNYPLIGTQISKTRRIAIIILGKSVWFHGMALIYARVHLSIQDPGSVQHAAQILRCPMILTPNQKDIVPRMLQAQYGASQVQSTLVSRLGFGATCTQPLSIQPNPKSKCTTPPQKWL